MNDMHATKRHGLALLLWLLAFGAWAGEGHGHEDGAAPADAHGAEAETHGDEGSHAHDEHADEPLVFTPEQVRMAGVRVETVRNRPLARELSAPGEVRANNYRSARVAARVQAQVVERLARLGDWVEAGAPMVTLSSVTVADAEGELLAAEREWARVRRLGRKAVSDRRYTEARLARDRLEVRLLAMGLDRQDIARLLKTGRSDGRFALRAPLAGRVLADAFVLGEVVQPGQVLFELTDERELWVDARLPAVQAARVRSGDAATVVVDGHRLAAEVMAVEHRLDEVSRTLGVRLRVRNEDDRLHPGQFVNVRIRTGEKVGQGVLLPESAVLRSADGDWQVFVVKGPGRFDPSEVEVLQRLPGRMAVGGLKDGTEVVVEGAFFVQSEQAKSGFAVHNH